MVEITSCFIKHRCADHVHVNGQALGVRLASFMPAEMGLRAIAEVFPTEIEYCSGIIG